MRDRIIAAVRTAVQNFITLALGSVVAWLASFGVEIVIGPEVIESLSSAVSLVLLAVGVGVWTWIQSWLEDKFPILVRFFSLNLTSGSGPEYMERVA